MYRYDINQDIECLFLVNRIFKANETVMTLVSHAIAINKPVSTTRLLGRGNSEDLSIFFKKTFLKAVLLLFITLASSMAYALCPNGLTLQTENYFTFQSYDDAWLFCQSLPFESHVGGIGSYNNQPYHWIIKTDTNEGCQWTSNCFYFANNECPAGQSPDPAQGNLCVTPEIIPVANQKNLGKPSVCIGNPCDPSTGNKYQRETDYSGSHTGLSFIRHYNSGLRAVDSGLGYGWTHQLIPSLEVSANLIVVHQADGRAESFALTDGVWQGDADTYLALTQGSTGFTLVTDQGVTERYDFEGRILSQTNLVNRQTDYSYNSNNLIDTIAGPFGHTLSFTYDANKRIVTMTDPDAGVYQYQYDSAGNLAKVIYPDTQFKRYHYENSAFPHALTGVTDANGDRFSTFAYRTDGKSISTEHASTSNSAPQEHFWLSYDSTTQTTVTDPIGTVDVLTFSENLDVKLLTRRINQTDNKGIARSYDANNNLSSSTDEEGKITAYAYNATNQRISITAALGTPEERSTQIQYLSPDLDLPILIVRPSIEAGQQAQTLIQYNPDHTVQSFTLSGYHPDGSAISRSTTFQYNTAGQVTQIDGPLTAVNDVTTLSYYACSSGTQCGQLASITNALSQTTHYDSYDNHGRVTQSTSPVGVITTYSYDVRGRFIQLIQTPPAGKGIARTTTFSYDNAGQLLSVTTPDNITLNYRYDPAHDLRSITDNLGNRIEYRYDLKGNRIDESIKDPNGNLIKTVQTGYDLRNRVQTINSAGSITQRIYDAVGNLVSEIDPNLNPASTHSYDALHRLQQTLDALDNATDYQYDSNDQLTQVLAPNDIITRYDYDDFGQLVKETSKDRGISSYHYDDAGNLLNKTDANNITATYSYDALNRMTAIDYPDTALDIRYRYDHCVNGIGRLCSVTDGHSRTRYQYDAWGNRTAIFKDIGQVTYNTLYQYDAGDNIRSITYPSGRQVAYQRDALARINNISSTWAGSLETIATQIVYLPFGPVETFILGNGLQEQRSYDLAFRLTDQVTPGLQDRVYHFDAAGNIRAIEQDQGTTSLALTDPDAVAETSTDTGDIAEEDVTTANGNTLSAQTASSYSYLYDVLHRLINETGPYGQRAYNYDANGNRQTRDKVDQLYDQQNLPTTVVTRNQNYRYPLDSQHLTQISTDKNGTLTNHDLRYDAAGNTLSKHNKNFAYDARNRINSYSKNGVLIAEYRYNAQGERIEKIKHTNNGAIHTLHFHYDQNGQLLGLTRYSNAGLLKAHKDIIWLDNIPVAQITTRYNNNGSEKSRQQIYLHTDHLNTPRIATDANQTVVWRWGSDAFGQGKPDTDPDQDGKKTFVPLRFPGQIASEGGLYYNYYRYYDPTTGRYISSDPIGLEGGINTYLYVNANPLKYTDPTGRCPWCVGVAVGGAIGGVGNAIGAHFNGGSVSDVGAAFVTGASTGVLFGATGGAAGSVTTFIATGATAGALTSGLTSLATGNNLSQVRDAALGGGAIGVLTGAFGHSTALANALANLRNSLSAAASIARGDLTGALAAALSGLGLGAFENVVKNPDSCKE